MKRIVFNISDDQEVLLDKLMKTKYLFSVSEAMRFLLVDCAERYLNNYKQVALQKLASKPTPKERATAQMDAQDERKKIKEEKWIESRRDICEVLGGSVSEDSGGHLVCIFNKFQELPGQRGIQSSVTTIPLELLTEEQITLQYMDMAGRSGLDIKEKLLAKQK